MRLVPVDPAVAPGGAVTVTVIGSETTGVRVADTLVLEPDESETPGTMAYAVTLLETASLWKRCRFPDTPGGPIQSMAGDPDGAGKVGTAAESMSRWSELGDVKRAVVAAPATPPLTVIAAVALLLEEVVL
jgi:hypothetical protein